MKKDDLIISRRYAIACLLAVGGLLAIAPMAAEAAAYLGPTAVVASQDGKSLLVANTDAKQVAVVDIAGGKVTKSIPVPAEPTGLALSPDGATLYVTCAAPQGTVCVVDVKSGKPSGSIPVLSTYCARISNVRSGT